MFVELNIFINATEKNEEYTFTLTFLKLISYL